MPAVLPVDTVLFYNITDTTTQSSTPGAAWSNYTPANNRYIYGTATQSEIGTTISVSGTATVTATYGTGGSHSGGTVLQTSPYNTTGAYSPYVSTAGSHSHSPGSMDLSSCLANTIGIVVVKSSEQVGMLPPGCIVFRQTAPTSLDFVEFTPSGTSSDGYYYGHSSTSNTVCTDRTTAYSGVVSQSSAGGVHSHVGGGSYFYWGTGAYSTVVYQNAGSHTDHSFTAPIKVRLKSKHLRAWVSTVEQPIEYGMIVPFAGTLASLPAGWRVCDGTLGTPDMTSYAVGHKSGGTSHNTAIHTTDDAVLSQAVTVTSSTSSWNHSHAGASTNLRGSGGYHSSTSVSHSHSVNVTAATGSYTAPHVRLAFIQYKGI